MTPLNGWKTAFGMALVLAGQIAHLLAPRWPSLLALGSILIDVGSGFGVVGLTHKAIKSQQVAE
jgi:hypothetical protein